MGLIISIVAIFLLVLFVYKYCRKLADMKNAIVSAKTDIDEMTEQKINLFANFSEISLDSDPEALAIAERLKKEIIDNAEKLSYMTEFYNVRVREYNKYVNTRLGMAAQNIMALPEVMKSCLQRKKSR